MPSDDRRLYELKLEQRIDQWIDTHDAIPMTPATATLKVALKAIITKAKLEAGIAFHPLSDEVGFAVKVDGRYIATAKMYKYSNRSGVGFWQIYFKREQKQIRLAKWEKMKVAISQHLRDYGYVSLLPGEYKEMFKEKIGKPKPSKLDDLL